MTYRAKERNIKGKGGEATVRKGTTAQTSKLARLRAAAGFGLRELSEASGVGIRQIQSFESGERDISNITLKNALALADALGVHPRELI